MPRDETVQLSDSDSEVDSSELPKDLAELRKNVKTNLKLRPIRSIPPETPLSSYFTPIDSVSLSPRALYLRLLSTRPLLLDTRPLHQHQSFHLQHSINLAIPSLILKRSKKPLHSLDALRPFITTIHATHRWDALMRPGGPWDGNVLIYDDNRDDTAPAIVALIQPLLSNRNTISYLDRPISTARHDPDLKTLIVSEHQHQHQHQQTPVLSAETPSPPPSSLTFKKPPNKRPSVPNLRRLDTKSAERLRDVPKLSLHTKPMRSATLAVPPSLFLPPLNLNHSNHLPITVTAPSPNPLSPTNDPSNYLTPYYTPPHTPLPDPPRTPLTARPEPEDPPLPAAAPPETDSYSFIISTILPNFLFLGPELTTQEHVQQLKSLGVKRILNIAAECDDDSNGLRLRDVFDKYYKIPMRDIVEEDNIANGVRQVCDILDDARLHSSPTYVHCKAGKSRSVTAVLAYLIHANHWTLSQAYAFVLERRKGISPNIGFVSELMNFEEQELGGKSGGVNVPPPPPPLPPPPPPSSSTTATANGDRSMFTTTTGHPPIYPLPSSRRTAHHHVRESLPPSLGIEGLALMTSIGMGGGGGPVSALEPSSSSSLSSSSTTTTTTTTTGTTTGTDTCSSRALLGDSGQEMEVKDASGKRYRHARRAPVDENTLQPLRRVSKAGLESC